MPHLNAGLHLLPGDARLLFYAGALHEAFASPSVQAASRALESRPNLRSEVGSVEAELELAERFFRQTLAADPRFAEARLRLGRVLGLLGRHEEAANELRRSIPQLETRSSSTTRSCFWVMRKRPCDAATRPASTSSAPPRSIHARSRRAWRSVSSPARTAIDPGRSAR